MKNNPIFIAVLALFMASFAMAETPKPGRPVFKDVPFTQNYSIKYYSKSEGHLQKAFTDRNGVIEVLSSEGLLRPYDGAFLYPGSLEPDGAYRPLADRKIVSMVVSDHQFVYLDPVAVLSNAWAGTLFSRHQMAGARIFDGDPKSAYLVADGTTLKCIKDSKVLWSDQPKEEVLDIRFCPETGLFWILGNTSLAKFSVRDLKMNIVFEGSDSL